MNGMPRMTDVCFEIKVARYTCAGESRENHRKMLTVLFRHVKLDMMQQTFPQELGNEHVASA
jgi:hypothetical protein